MTYFLHTNKSNEGWRGWKEANHYKCEKTLEIHIKVLGGPCLDPNSNKFNCKKIFLRQLEKFQNGLGIRGC